MLLITITSYNKGNFVGALLNSLKDQISGKSNVKVIFVDDASTDSTVEIVKTNSIYNLDNFELIVNPENLWVSASRNVGISKLESGDRITFIDGDDTVKENYVSTLLSYIDDNTSDVYQFDYDNFSDNPEIDTSSIEKAENIMVWSRLYRGDFLISKDILFRDKPYKEEGFGEDYAFNAEVISNGAVNKVTNDIIYNYRWGVDGSLSNTHI